MEYLFYKNSKWIDTGEKCERDNETVFREILEDGTETNHYCCERLGCTKQQYRARELNVINQ